MAISKFSRKTGLLISIIGLLLSATNNTVASPEDNHGGRHSTTDEQNTGGPLIFIPKDIVIYDQRYELAEKRGFRPLYIDLDGDNKMELLAYVVNTHNNKTGILIANRSGRYTILFAGTPVPNAARFGTFDDLSVLKINYWGIYDGPPITKAPESRQPPRAKGELIFLQKSEAFVLYLYLAETGYVVY